MKKIRKIIMFVVIIFAGILLASCKGNKQDKADKLELESVKQLLNVGFTNEGDKASGVTANLDLMTTFENATITWSSDNVAISNDGKVTRGEENVRVTLTATIKVGKFEDTKTFPITVLAEAFAYYRVSYNALGGSPTPPQEEVREGRSAAVPEEPERERYDFLGWYVEDSEEAFDFGDPITENVSLIAKWELVQPEVAFNLSYSSTEQIPTQRLNLGQKVVKPTDPVRDRYTFEGWYLDGELFNFGTEIITKDIVLIAQWSQDDVIVTFDLGYDAEAPEDQSIAYNGKAVKPATDPARDRFEFVGWVIEGQEVLYDFNLAVTRDLNLVAKWNQLEAVIIFDVAGGTPNPDTVTLDVGQKVTRPNEPTRDGYEFLGWFSGSTLYDFDLEVESDLNLVANWRDALVVVSATIVAPDAVTHYMGTTTFNPLLDVLAIDNDSGEELDVFVSVATYRDNIPGTYTYKVAVLNDPSIEKTIKLTVKPAVAIPNELSKSRIEISLGHSNGATIENKLKQYAEDFEKLMRAEGYDIKVTIDKRGSTYDELRTNIINAIKGSTLPNLVQNYPDHVVEYDKNGVIESLAPYMFHPVHGFDPDDPYERFEDIIEAYRLESKSSNLIGDYLSLPFSKSTEVVVYNKTFFDAVLKGRAFPETWQGLFGLIDDILEIKDQQIDGIASKWADAKAALPATEIQKIKDEFVPYTLDSMGNSFITLSRQFNGAYTSRDPVTGKGQVDFINEQTIRMLEFFAEDRGRTFTVPKFWGVDYGNSVSKKGYTIFTTGSTGGIRYNVPIQGGYKLFDVGVAPLPYDMHNPSSKAAIQQGPNISLTNTGTADEKLASWLFLKYLTSREVQVDYALAVGYHPIRHSSYDVPAYQEFLNKADTIIGDSASAMGISNSAFTTLFETKLMAMAGRVAQEQTAYNFYDEPFIGSSKAREAAGEAFERIILYTGSDLETEINNALQSAKEETDRIIP